MIRGRRPKSHILRAATYYAAGVRATAAVLLLIVASCGGAPPAPSAHHGAGDRPAVHGMLLFGERRQYLSHLPLFHAPHDYQIIIAAELDGGADEKGARTRYLDDRRRTGTAVYTFVPERFRLPDLAFQRKAGAFRFRGEVVRGHFERGGTEIDRGVRVTPRVIFAEKLAPEGKVSGDTWLLFGARDEAYLAHLVAGPPDFDQIVAVDAPAEVRDADLARGVRLSAGIAGRPLSENAAVSATLADGRTTSLKVRNQIYLETNDLAD
jgi:hypothetical protein